MTAGPPDDSPATAALQIKAEAHALGFEAAGICGTDCLGEAAPRLARSIAAGYHGTMAWLADRLPQRMAPKGLWRDARAVVMVASNYGPDHDPMETLSHRDRGNISVYARNRDYHDVMKKRLKALGRWMAQTYGCRLKVFVDTAPVMEKPLAAAAGLGWQGKHSNLVSRRFGSWLFLGALYTDMALAPDTAEVDHCGSCRACLDVCPTDAFPAPYRLDARRCISYLTIEHKGPIPVEFRRAVGNRIYGCDDCLAVCPWNKFARIAQESAYWARAELKLPRLVDLAGLDDAGFRAVFSGSPIKRIGRDRFLRNVLIALGNSDDPQAATAARPHLHDPSALVRGAAVWALKMQLDEPAFATLRNTHQAGEDDASVQAEWMAC